MNVKERGHNDVFVTVRIDVDNIKRIQAGIECHSVQFVPVVKSEKHYDYLSGISIDGECL